MPNASKRALNSLKIKRLDLNGSELLIIDGKFAEQQIGSVFRFLSKLPYQLNDVDSHETSYSKHWKAEFPRDVLAQTPILSELEGIVTDFFPDETQKLVRAHSNLHLYGDLQFPHQDTKDDGLTVIYYANAEWNPDWMGETIFYGDDGEPLYAIAPKPGRIVIFRGAIVHRAGVPSRAGFAPRISFALKFSARKAGLRKV